MTAATWAADTPSLYLKIKILDADLARAIAHVAVELLQKRLVVLGDLQEDEHVLVIGGEEELLQAHVVGVLDVAEDSLRRSSPDFASSPAGRSKRVIWMSRVLRSLPSSATSVSSKERE